MPNARPINGHFFPALRGKTTFPFHFTIPKDAATSCVLGGAASRAYELIAFASTLDRDGGERHSQERVSFSVLERWEDWQGQEDGWGGTLEAKKTARVARAGNGVLEVSAEVGVDEDSPARLFWRADKERALEGKTRVQVVARVKNNTTKPASGMKLQLVRQLRPLRRGDHPDGQDDELPTLLTIPVAAAAFTGDEFDFAPGQKKQVTMSIEVPAEEGWNTRRGRLFRLDCAVLVELHGAALDRPVVVELPVWIANPRSLPPPAHHHVAKRLAKQRSELPSLLPDQDSYLHQPSHHHRAGSTVSLSGPPAVVSHSPLPFGHHSPSSTMHLLSGPSGMSSYEYAPGTHPSQQALSHHEFGAPSPAHSPSVGQLYQAGPPPVDPLVYYSQHVQQQPQQHQAYPSSFLPPPSHPNSGASTLSSTHSAHTFHYNSAGGAYSAPAPPSVRGSAYHSSGDSFRQPSPSQQSYVSSAPSHSPAPSVYGPPPGHALPPTQQPQQHYHDPAHYSEKQWQNHTQVYAQPHPPSLQAEQGYQPGELFASVLARPDQPEQPQPQPQPQHLQHPSPPRQRSSSIGSHRSGHSLHRTTPPASPSTGAAGYRAPSPARSIPLPSQHSLAQAQVEEDTYAGLGPTAAEVALETIGEDGESQAGTARSVAPGTVQALGAPGGVQDPEELRCVGGGGRRNSVQDLEEMVRQQDEEREVRTRLEERRKDKEHRKAGAGAVKAMDIFAAPQAEAPPSPVTLTSPDTASPSPPKSPAPSLIQREAGGLSALEARLLKPASPSLPFPSSPTQPPPRTLSSSPSSVVGLRAAGSTSALRQRSISRASGERALAERLAREDPKEAVRRALEAAGGPRSRPGSPLKPSAEKADAEPQVEEPPVQVQEEAPEAQAVRNMSAQVEGALAAPTAEGVGRSSSVQSLLAAVQAEAELEERRRKEAGEGFEEQDHARDGSAARSALASERRWEDETLEATSAWEEQLPTTNSTHDFFEPVVLPQAEVEVEVESYPIVARVDTPMTELAYRAASPPVADAPPSIEQAARRALPEPPVALAERAASPVAAPTLVDGRKVMNVQEQRDLKKEAAARMAQWIRTGASPTKAPSMSSPWTTKASPTQAKRVFARTAPPPPQASEGEQTVPVSPSPSSAVDSSGTSITRQRLMSSPSPAPARAAVLATPPASPTRLRLQSNPTRPNLTQAQPEPTVAQLLAAESRAAMRAHSDENQAAGAVPSTPPASVPYGYDVRSARGGKGGAVAQVGSKWKLMIAEEERKRQADHRAEEDVRAAAAAAKRASAPPGSFGAAERMSLRNLNLGGDGAAPPASSGAGKRFSVNVAAGGKPDQVVVGVKAGGGIAALRAKWESQRD